MRSTLNDDEADFWLFRLGLRPARSAPLRAAPSSSAPLPSTDQLLTAVGSRSVPLRGFDPYVVLALLEVDQARNLLYSAFRDGRRL
jgi:hypothetical protein